MFSRASINLFMTGWVILTLALASPAAAQHRATAQVGSECPNKQQTQTRAKKGDVNGQVQSAQSNGATRRLGPGDGAGNQGVKPENGTGNGSPGRLGDVQGNGNGKGKGNKNGKAAKSGKGNSRSTGSVKGSMTRSRARDLSASGSGTCTGAGAGSQRRAVGSRGSRGGGRR